MKKTLLILSLFITYIISAQEAYYDGIDFTAEGLELKEFLSIKTIAAHTNPLSYSDIWNSSKITDEDPENESNVLLIYGYDDNDGNYITDRSRNKNLNGGTNGSDWNREHTYANSLATPKLEDSGTSGPPYAEAFNLRPSDVKMNSNRGNTKFADGAGNAGNQNGGWYPGDEWKGDVARMMMYMYIRYGDQCKPTGVGFGNLVWAEDEMIDLFLEWNVEDPVSDFERQRNTYHDSNADYAQGNRNPFIDNAYLATRIWGGEEALDSWGIYITPDTEAPTVPTNVNLTNITTTSIVASWTASTDNKAVTRYEVYSNGILQGNTASTTYSLTGLKTNTTYSITVLAKDIASNKSAQSTAVNATTLTDNTPPTIPTDITISNESGSSFKVSWTASNDDSSVESYNIYLDGALNGTTTTTTYTAIGLAPSTTYSITISAKDIASNESDQSATVSATTTVASSTCGAETFDNIPSNGSSYSSFSWTGDDGIDWSAVKSRTDEPLINGKAIMIALYRDNTEGSITSSTFANGIGKLTASTKLIYSGGSGNINVLVNGTVVGSLPYGADLQTTTISNIDITGNVIIEFRRSGSETDRVLLDDLSWTCYSTLSTEEEVFNSFKMYPNPTGGNTVYFKITESAEVKVYNVLGKLLKKATINSNNNSIDTSNLTKGIYLVKINSDNQSITKKLIKN